MDTILTILIYVFLFSAIVRHICRTITFIEDMREKVKNRRLEQYKH